MPKLSLPVARLVRENVSVLMTYAFSRTALEKFSDVSLDGEWKLVRETIFGLSEQRAEKACLELAIFLRYLDDEEGLSASYSTSSNLQFGELQYRDGSSSSLKLRDVANKIIHAVAFEWDLSKPMKPFLICNSRDKEQWIKARIDVATVAVVCGNLLG